MNDVTVDAATLRRLFNEAGIHERALDGELLEWIVYEGDPDPSSGEPPGTRSQLIDYLERGERVAQVHQYLRDDGSLGASGLPDPKLVVLDGVTYRLSPRPEGRRPRTRRRR